MYAALKHERTNIVLDKTRHLGLMGYFCSQKCNLVQARAICKYEIITEIYATEGIRWCCFHLRNMSGGVEVENNNSIMEL